MHEVLVVHRDALSHVTAEGIEVTEFGGERIEGENSCSAWRWSLRGGLKGVIEGCRKVNDRRGKSVCWGRSR